MGEHDAFLAAHRAKRRSNAAETVWNLGSTAPRDGRWFVLVGDFDCLFLATWHSGAWCTVVGGEEMYEPMGVDLDDTWFWLDSPIGLNL